MMTQSMSSAMDLFKRKNLQPSFRKLLEKHGNEEITGMTIVRTPLKSWTEMLLNIFSLYEFSKVKNKNNYDSYFHLTLNITTDKNTKLLLEKNEVLNLELGQKMENDSEYMTITNIPHDLTLLALIERAKVKQGNKFFNYKASSNNCQIFIRDVLLANGINNEEYIKFIVQDTQSIFENNAFLRKTANTVTDIASVANNVVYGTGVNSQFAFDRRLTNIDLEELSKIVHVPLKGIFLKDMIPKKLSNGSYIVNLNSSGENGSHWTAFIKTTKEVFYFDPFGVYPVQNLMDIADKLKLQTYYNMTQLQDMSSILCGYFCIAYLYFMLHNKGTMFEKCIRFDKLFKKNTKQNDKLLIAYMKEILQFVGN